MKDFKIYLCSDIDKTLLPEQVLWRDKVKKYLNQWHLQNTKIKFIDLTDYSCLQSLSPVTEVINFDLRSVKNSDLILVYFNNAHSVNLVQELTIGWEYRIPIIAIKPEAKNISKRLTTCCERVFTDLYEACDHIIDIYLR